MRRLRKKSQDDFLRRHYPHQVKGSKLTYFLSAREHELPCYSLFAFMIARRLPSVKYAAQFFRTVFGLLT